MYGITSTRESTRLIIKSADNGLVHIIEQDDIQDMSEKAAIKNEMFALKHNGLYDELHDTSKVEIQKIVTSYVHDICRE